MLLLLVGGCCELQHNVRTWSTRDIALEAATAAAISLDWWQSVPVVQTCNETNPILGACGQRVPPIVFFPGAMVLHAAGTALLPSSWRPLWQGLAIGLEVNQAWTTYNLGWKVKL